MNNHVKLTLAERKLIAQWLDEGISLRECARHLSRSHTTIVRELRRNKHEGKFYEPLHAQWKADNRKSNAWSGKHPLKNKDIYDYTTKRLRRGWSPEAIAGRLKKVDHPKNTHWEISHEAIYRFCYNPRFQREREGMFWWEYLRRKQKRRRKQRGRGVHRARIPDRVSIHERPSVVNKRTEFGHWEGDTVVGRGRDHGIHTEYERVASFTRIEKMNDLTSGESAKAQIRIFSSLPDYARRSTTLDNGHEHVRHKEVEKVCGTKTYFADPYSAYQRGGNENANMWIRYYFPKGTDFRIIPEQDIRDVEWELNNRPRKRLGYKTPQEVFTYYLVRS